MAVQESLVSEQTLESSLAAWGSRVKNLDSDIFTCSNCILQSLRRSTETNSGIILYFLK